MPTVKVTINGRQKLKVKTSTRRAKDIKVDSCPDHLVSDTVTFFKSPESLALTKENVAHISSLCERHSAVLNLKPAFLMRITELKREIERVEEEKRKEAERIEEDRKRKEEEERERVEAELLEQQKRAEELEEKKRSTAVEATDLEQQEEIMTQFSNDMKELLEGDKHRISTTGDEEHLNSIMRELTEDLSELDTTLGTFLTTEGSVDEEGIRVKESRTRIVDLRECKTERDLGLLLKVVSPKQRTVTRYKSYSPTVVRSPVFGVECDPLTIAAQP